MFPLVYLTMFTIHLEVVVYFLGTIIKDMDQEEQRYVREGFSSDEELSLYDMLFSENLSKQDIQKIKKVAVDLLEKVKAKITELDHWTDKQETKATINNLIRDTLWAELPESYDEVIQLVIFAFQTGNAFLFAEIGKVDWVLGLAFWTLGANVADRI